MPIEVAIATSSEQDQKLEALLVTMNEQREQQGKPPLASVNAMARHALVAQLKGWVEMADAEVVKEFAGLFSIASTEQREEIMEILLPTP